MIKKEILLQSLLSLPRVGRKTATEFLKFKSNDFNNINDIYDAIRSYISMGKKFPNVSKEQISESFNKSEILINKTLDQKFAVITFDHENYPKKLQHIDDPPLILYAKGNLETLNKESSVALIGKRKVSRYGSEASEQMGYNFAKENFVIVSGLALGCDTHAHKGCVKANGLGIAVLAHGLDQVHPNSNKNLVDKLIEKNGLLITEYSLGTNPMKFNYVERDRIQSGLSEAVIVLESDEISGTMQTVQFAEKQERPIGVLDFPVEAYEQGIALGNKLLIKEKRGYALNLNDDLITFYQSITEDKSYSAKNKKDKPTQGNFDF